MKNFIKPIIIYLTSKFYVSPAPTNMRTLEFFLQRLVSAVTNSIHILCLHLLYLYLRSYVDKMLH